MAIIAGKPDETPRRLFEARDAGQLRQLLDSWQLSTRGLAALLEVSHMWVQRRARGEVPISPEDTERIRATLANTPPF